MLEELLDNDFEFKKFMCYIIFLGKSSVSETVFTLWACIYQLLMTKPLRKQHFLMKTLDIVKNQHAWQMQDKLNSKLHPLQLPPSGPRWFYLNERSPSLEVWYSWQYSRPDLIWLLETFFSKFWLSSHKISSADVTTYQNDIRNLCRNKTDKSLHHLIPI